MTQARAPVLLLVFNRPETTREVFESIRRARPTRLYVAADGPRKNPTGERERCDEARRVATSVDWPCEVRTLFRERNLGCGLAVSSALDWFFEHEPEGIILEDDCVAHPTFFAYCEELLERYRDDPTVVAVSGDCYHPDAHALPASYFFSRHPQIWGWASWRRAWRFNDRTLARWPQLRETDWLLRIGDGDREFCEYWREIFDMVHSRPNDIWGYQWVYSCWLQNGLSILPARNLIRNIGFGADATHTRGDGGWMATQPLEAISLPLLHPPAIERDRAADRWMDLHVFKIHVPRYRKVLRKVPGLSWGVRQLRRLVS